MSSSGGGWSVDQLPSFPYVCPTCEEARTITEVAKWNVTPGEDDDFDPHRWSLGRCDHCQSPLLFLAMEPNWGGSGFADLRQIFPEQQRQLPGYVPAPIREAFEEAQTCLRAKAFTASALMSRRVLELIVSDSGYDSGSTLAARFERMRTDTKMDPRLAQWADAIRVLGNGSAHDADVKIGREDALEVMVFVEALIDYHYVFEYRYERFQRRRSLIREGKDPDALEPLLFPEMPEPPRAPVAEPQPADMPAGADVRAD